MYSRPANLGLPIDKRNVLISPPPSPPLGWKSGPEEMNSIPFLDLTLTQIGNEKVLLPEFNGMPKITITPEDEL